MAKTDQSLPALPSPNILTLYKFFNFLEMNQGSAPEIIQEKIAAFLNLIKDPKEVILTGSSVLQYFRKMDFKINDFDFFIKGTPENIKIIFDVFQDEDVTKYLTKCYCKFYNFNTLLECHRKHFLLSESNRLIIASDIGIYQDNDFFDVVSSYFQLGNFKYNFIFVSHKKESGSALMALCLDKPRSNRFIHGTIYYQIFKSTKIYNNKAYKAIEFPHIIYIILYFDFEELKLAFSLKNATVDSLYKILVDEVEWAKDNSVDFNTFINSKSYRKKIYDEWVNTAKKIHEEHLELLNDTTDRLTLSLTRELISKIKEYSIFQIITEKIDNGDIATLTKIFNEVLMRYYRILKYKERGFTIYDPDGVYLRAQALIITWYKKILAQSDIQKMHRKTILFNGVESIKAYKLIETLITTETEFIDGEEIEECPVEISRIL